MEIGALMYERKHALRSEVCDQGQRVSRHMSIQSENAVRRRKSHKKVKSTPGELWTITLLVILVIFRSDKADQSRLVPIKHPRVATPDVTGRSLEMCTQTPIYYVIFRCIKLPHSAPIVPASAKGLEGLPERTRSQVPTYPASTLWLQNRRLLRDFRLARGHNDLAAYASSALRWRSATPSQQH